MRQLLESWNEYINVEQSINEIGQCHDPSTGHFDKCTKGNVYSVSKRGAKAGNLDPKYVARGKLTQDKPEETESADDYKMKSPFGLNHGKKQGGRIKPQGGKHSPVRSVANYPDKYRRAGKDENQGRGDDSSDLELLEMDKDGNESERERHERLFPGSDSMARLAMESWVNQRTPKRSQHTSKPSLLKSSRHYSNSWRKSCSQMQEPRANAHSLKL